MVKHLSPENKQVMDHWSQFTHLSPSCIASDIFSLHGPLNVRTSVKPWFDPLYQFDEARDINYLRHGYLKGFNT